MALQTCQQGNVASRSMPPRGNINGLDRPIFGKSAPLDRPIFGKSAKRGRVIFVNFVIFSVVREFGFSD